MHDLSILQYHNSQGIRYLGSCRMNSVEPVNSNLNRTKKQLSMSPVGVPELSYLDRVLGRDFPNNNQYGLGFRV